MNRLKLTDRDFKLFKFLASTGFLGSSHIQEKFFAGAARTTVLRRLRMLESKSYIKRVLGLESQEILWMLTSKGAREVGVTVPKTHWSKNMLEHDYQLVDLRMSLEASGIVHSWMPEHQIRSELFKKHGPKDFQERVVPDGLIGIQVNGKNESVALELELTLKNQTRIRKTLKRYLSKGGVYALWYVAPKMSILNSVWKHWQLNGGLQNKVKLHCSLLDEVLDSPLKARLLGTKPVLTVGQSWIINGVSEAAHRVSTPKLITMNQNEQVNESNHTPNLKSVS